MYQYLLRDATNCPPRHRFSSSLDTTTRKQPINLKFPTPSPSPATPLRSRSNLIMSTKIHIMALDGIVNVNSLFTLALFLGLAWYPTSDSTTTLVTDACCAAGSTVAESLIAFHVYSFASFMFSSLIALAIKETIKIVDKDDSFDDDFVGGSCASVAVHVNLVALRTGTLVSGFGSVFGCGFLMMALVDLVQIKLGTLACGSLYTYAAITPLLILVPSALIFYIVLALHAFIR